MFGQKNINIFNNSSLKFLLREHSGQWFVPLTVKYLIIGYLMVLYETTAEAQILLACLSAMQ